MPSSTSHPVRSSRRRRALVLAGGLSIGCAVAHVEASRLVHTIVASKLRALVGRDVPFESVSLDTHGLTLRGAHVTGDSSISVRSVRVDCDWASILRGGLRVPAMRMDDVVVRVTARPSSTPAPASPNWSADLLAHAHAAGLMRVDVRNAAIEIRTGAAASANVRGLGAIVQFGPNEAVVDLVANQVETSAAPLTWRDAHAHARLDRTAIHMDRFAAPIEDGAIMAHGDYVIASGDFDGRIDATDLRASTIARVIAKNANVPANGWIDASLRVRGTGGVFTSARGDVSLRDASVRDATTRWSGSVSMTLDATSRAVKLSSLHARSDALAVGGEVAFVHDAAHTSGTPWGVQGAGSLRAGPQAIAALASRLSGTALRTIPFRARLAKIDFEVHGPLGGDLSALAGRGHVALDHLWMRPVASAAAIEASRVEADVIPSREGLALRDVHAVLPGGVVDGSLSLRGTSPFHVTDFRADGRVAVRDMREVRRLAPSLPAWRIVETSDATRVNATFHAEGSLSDHRHRSLAADWVVTNVRVGRGIRLPSKETVDVAIARASGRIEYVTRSRDEQLHVRDVRLDTSVGSLTVDADARDGAHRITIAARQATAEALRWVLPGVVRGGRIDGVATLEGDSHVAVRLATGRFAVTNAAYAFPRELGLTRSPIAVSSARGEFRASNGRVEVTGLTVRSDLGDGQGSVSVIDGVTRIRGDLRSADASRVMEIWPMLHGMARGGHGVGQIDMAIDARGVRGTVSAHVENGTVLVPDAPPEIATQPIARADLRLRFGPMQLAIESLAIRGPKANLDLRSEWNFDGAVRGQGRAWLTREYSHQLLTGWNWLVRMFGVRALSTDFTIDGPATAPRLHAGITRTLLWRLGNGRIPRRAREIASGRVPLG